MSNAKPAISVIVIGDVHSGKSSLIEHLVYMRGGVDKRTKERYEKEAATKGSVPFKLAMKMLRYYASQSPIIIDDKLFNKFESVKHLVTMMKTSDDRDFLHVMDNIVQADCVVLIISACIDDFEAYISEHDQMREQILLAYVLGTKPIIVAINKMDADDISYSEHHFDRIQSQVSNYLQKIGYRLEHVAFVPISALNGDNLVVVSNKMPWFNGWIIECHEGTAICRTFLEILDIIIQPRQLANKSLRLPLKDVYKVHGIGTVAFGRVHTGVLKLNMPVCFVPSNVTATVKSIERQYQALTEALPGDIVGFHVNNISAKQLRRGLVCSDVKNDPAQEAASFIAQIVVLNHPSQIELGDSLLVYCHTARINCQLVELFKKVHHQTGETIETSANSIKSGDLATIKLVPLESMCVEKFHDYPSLGHFAIRHMNRMVAVGIIKDVEWQEKETETEQCS